MLNVLGHKKGPAANLKPKAAGEDDQATAIQLRSDLRQSREGRPGGVMAAFRRDPQDHRGDTRDDCVNGSSGVDVPAHPVAWDRHCGQGALGLAPHQVSFHHLDRSADVPAVGAAL